MIKIGNCTKIDLKNLDFNIESIRTRNKSLYVKDELFKTLDKNFLIHCHSISEGGMGAYYCQQAIFRNNKKQDIILNLNNFWTPIWVNNFKYILNQRMYLTSVTCYDKISKENPIPQIMIDTENHNFSLFKKDDEIDFKKNIKWSYLNNEIDICKIFRNKNAM